MSTRQNNKTGCMLLAGLLLAAAPALPRAEEMEVEVHADEGEMGPGEIKKVMREIREADPEMYRELMRLRKRHPDRFRKEAREHADIFRDPEKRKMWLVIRKSELSVRKLSRAYREAKGDGEKEKIKKDLRAALAEQFAAKLKSHEEHVKKMEAELAHMKKRIAKRRKLRDKIVERRLGELIGEEESWELFR